MPGLLIAQALLLQARAHPRAQQHRVEGLGEIVLRAQLDAADHRVHLVERRDHQDGDVAQLGVRLELAQHLGAALARHQHVEQDEVEGARAERLEGLVPAGDGAHLMPLPPSRRASSSRLLRIVVDDEDDAGLGRGHPAPRPDRGLLGRVATSGSAAAELAVHEQIEQVAGRRRHLVEIRPEIVAGAAGAACFTSAAAAATSAAAGSTSGFRSAPSVGHRRAARRGRRAAR